MTFASAMLLAMALDMAIGWPDALFHRIGHPVTWIGRLIDRLDRAWNAGDAPRRRLAGLAACVVVLAVTAALAALLVALSPPGWPKILVTGILAWPFLAIRSLHGHVDAVATPLAAGDLDGARQEVAKIVGRDPALLDAAGVARASLESLAENTSDAIVAPLFWGLLLGLPGIAAYKALNTLDSMIGHRTERHEAFGMISARLDDVANLIPARLSGVLFALVSATPRRALGVMLRDARHHRSPNAGWPESALAGALHVRLSGPRAYHARVSQEPWLNEGTPDPTAKDLKSGLALYRRLIGAVFMIFALLAVLL